MPIWYLIDNKAEYETAVHRYGSIRDVEKSAPEYKEKMLLAHLINHYEQGLWDIPQVDPIGLIRIRMEELGYKPADLVREYGDKGTVSKVLNYKQALSLTMIRKFSKLLRIPVEALVRAYKLKK